MRKQRHTRAVHVALAVTMRAGSRLKVAWGTSRHGLRRWPGASADGGVPQPRGTIIAGGDDAGAVWAECGVPPGNIGPEAQPFTAFVQRTDAAVTAQGSRLRRDRQLAQVGALADET